MEKYAPRMQTGGILLLDASLISERSRRNDIQQLAIPAKGIADELGVPQVANIVMLGALVEATGVVALETLARVLAEHTGTRHRDLLSANQAALTRGAEYVRERIFVTEG
jgi:2-oxoglutarate ferredoxin oxidoreductase subunit gamma